MKWARYNMNIIVLSVFIRHCEWLHFIQLDLFSGCMIEPTSECANIDVDPIYTERIPLQDLPQIFRQIYLSNVLHIHAEMYRCRYSYIMERVQYG